MTRLIIRSESGHETRSFVSIAGFWIGVKCLDYDSHQIQHSRREDQGSHPRFGLRSLLMRNRYDVPNVVAYPKVATPLAANE